MVLAIVVVTAVADDDNDWYIASQLGEHEIPCMQ